MNRKGRGGRPGRDAQRENSKHKAKIRREVTEIEALNVRIQQEAPPKGSMEAPATKFDELPISKATLGGTHSLRHGTDPG